MKKNEVKEWYLCNEYEHTDLEKWVEDIILNVNVEQELAKGKTVREDFWNKSQHCGGDDMLYFQFSKFYVRCYYKYSALILEDAIKNKRSFEDMKVQIEHYKNIFKYLNGTIYTNKKTDKTVVKVPFYYDDSFKALYNTDDDPAPPHKQNKDMMIAALYNEDVFNAIVKNFKSIYSLQPFNEDIRNIL